LISAQHEISAVSKLETDEISGKAKKSIQDGNVEALAGEKAKIQRSATKKRVPSLLSQSSLFDKKMLKRSKSFIFGLSEEDSSSKLTAFNVETKANGLNGGATFNFRAGLNA
jgi:hypothetical protein